MESVSIRKTAISKWKRLNNQIFDLILTNLLEFLNS